MGLAYKTCRMPADDQSLLVMVRRRGVGYPGPKPELLEFVHLVTTKRAVPEYTFKGYSPPDDWHEAS